MVADGTEHFRQSALYAAAAFSFQSFLEKRGTFVEMVDERRADRPLEGGAGNIEALI